MIATPMNLLNQRAALFTPFDELKITTQTFVVHTGLSIPLEALFASIDCTPMNQIPSKKLDWAQESLEDGDIVYIQFHNDNKGLVRNIKRKQMLNVVTIIVVYRRALYNIKIAHSGKLQMTGCRVLDVVLFLTRVVIRRVVRLLSAPVPQPIVCYLLCVMSNVNIELPFRVNRDKLHLFINQRTPHVSILEKSVGYVGVNIKILSKVESKEETTIDVARFTLDDEPPSLEKSTFGEYIQLCNAANKKYKRTMYNSFLVFESGRTIMSGCASYANRKNAYEIFMNLVLGARDEIAWAH